MIIFSPQITCLFDVSGGFLGPCVYLNLHPCGSSFAGSFTDLSIDYSQKLEVPLGSLLSFVCTESLWMILTEPGRT